MRPWRSVVGSLALCLSATGAAGRTFTLCAAEANPPMSYSRSGRPLGLDVRIGEAVAAELGRAFKLLPFESKYEKERQLTHEVNALLSSGMCDAASGFPLLASDLGPPTRRSMKPPDYPGAKRYGEREPVTLQPLVGSGAYLSVSLGLVLRGGIPSVSSLDDLRRDARRIGAVSGTLGGALAIGWRGGILQSQLHALAQNENVFAELEAGRIDAAIVPLTMFDGWRVAHSSSPLVAAAWYRPLGVNIGFVTLEHAGDLRRAIDDVITRALANGTLARWAEEERVTWLPPQMPAISQGPQLSELLNGEQ